MRAVVALAGFGLVLVAIAVVTVSLGTEEGSVLETIQKAADAPETHVVYEQNDNAYPSFQKISNGSYGRRRATAGPQNPMGSQFDKMFDKYFNDPDEDLEPEYKALKAKVAAKGKGAKKKEFIVQGNPSPQTVEVIHELKPLTKSPVLNKKHPPVVETINGKSYEVAKVIKVQQKAQEKKPMQQKAEEKKPMQQKAQEKKPMKRIAKATEKKQAKKTLKTIPQSVTQSIRKVREQPHTKKVLVPPQSAKEKHEEAKEKQNEAKATAKIQKAAEEKHEEAKATAKIQKAEKSAEEKHEEATATAKIKKAEKSAEEKHEEAKEKHEEATATAKIKKAEKSAEEKHEEATATAKIQKAEISAEEKRKQSDETNLEALTLNVLAAHGTEQNTPTVVLPPTSVGKPPSSKAMDALHSHTEIGDTVTVYPMKTEPLLPKGPRVEAHVHRVVPVPNAEEKPPAVKKQRKKEPTVKEAVPSRKFVSDDKSFGISEEDRKLLDSKEPTKGPWKDGNSNYGMNGPWTENKKDGPPVASVLVSNEDTADDGNKDDAPPWDPNALSAPWETEVQEIQKKPVVTATMVPVVTAIMLSAKRVKKAVSMKDLVKDVDLLQIAAKKCAQRKLDLVKFCDKEKANAATWCQKGTDCNTAKLSAKTHCDDSKKAVVKACFRDWQLAKKSGKD